MFSSNLNSKSIFLLNFQKQRRKLFICNKSRPITLLIKVGIKIQTVFYAENILRVFKSKNSAHLVWIHGICPKYPRGMSDVSTSCSRYKFKKKLQASQTLAAWMRDWFAKIVPPTNMFDANNFFLFPQTCSLFSLPLSNGKETVYSVKIVFNFF